MAIKRKTLCGLWTFALGAALSVQAVSADEARLRLLFADVPATSKIAVGDLSGGIEQLENRLEQDPDGAAGDNLATLCGAYVLQASFRKAESVCDLAVQIDASGIALNNRGVLRALTGDVEGARADFNRVRPKNMTEYMNALRQSDLGLVTADNFELVDRTITVRTSISAYDIAGAKVEDIMSQPQ